MTVPCGIESETARAASCGGRCPRARATARGARHGAAHDHEHAASGAAGSESPVVRFPARTFTPVRSRVSKSSASRRASRHTAHASAVRRGSGVRVTSEVSAIRSTRPHTRELKKRRVASTSIARMACHPRTSDDDQAKRRAGFALAFRETRVRRYRTRESSASAASETGRVFGGVTRAAGCAGRRARHTKGEYTPKEPDVPVEYRVRDVRTRPNMQHRAGTDLCASTLRIATKCHRVLVDHGHRPLERPGRKVDARVGGCASTGRG